MNREFMPAGGIEILIFVGIVLFNVVRAYMNHRAEKQAEREAAPRDPERKAARPAFPEEEAIPGLDDLMEALGRPKQKATEPAPVFSPPPVPVRPSSVPVPQPERARTWEKVPEPPPVPRMKTRPPVVPLEVEPERDRRAPWDVATAVQEVKRTERLTERTDGNRIERQMNEQAAAMDVRQAAFDSAPAGEVVLTRVGFRSRALRAALREPEALRTVIVMSEILGAPKGLR